MKLLLLLEHRFYEIGGEVFCERIVNYKYLSRYLKVFDEVVVCARFGSNPPAKKVLASGAGVNFLPLPDFIGSKGILKRFGKCQKILRNHINSYDAVIIRSPSPISVIAYSIVKKSGLPFAAEIVINPQTMFCKDSYSSKLQPLLSWFFTTHTKKICSTANGVSYVTKYVLQELYPCKGMNSDSDSYFTEHYSSIDLSKEQCSHVFHTHVKGSPYIIAHTGYMDSYSKGHIIVMDVAKQLIDSGLSVEVRFIGTGTMEKEFRDYAIRLGISEKVVFCGSLNGYSEVQKELLKADLFLFPTCSEGLPRSLIEAMANNIACVSSPVDGIVELLPEQYLADYKDQQSIFTICKKLLNDETERKKAADNCYTKAQEYTSDVLEKRRTYFYKKLFDLANKTK